MGITETPDGVTIITTEADPAPTLIVTEDGTVNILTVIERGPQGRPGVDGQDGESTGIIWKILEGETVTIPARQEFAINSGIFRNAGTLSLGAESILLVRT
jgi:hypothetical protein